MVIAEFETLLRRTIGLDPSSLGAGAVERAVQQRQAACRLLDLETYWTHLCGSADELQELIETVVVPETSFFRHRESFAVLSGTVWPAWIAGGAQEPMRLLSLPCSTGEEPYSMAIALLDAGAAPARFQVDAVDISERALVQARAGVYGNNAFRGNEQNFRERYFRREGPGYRLDDGVRRQVRFEHGNLFSPGFLPGTGLYDVIFCRNVLIYFDRAAQTAALAVLARLLKSDGFLFLGPAESGISLGDAFVSVRQPQAFAFRRADVVAPPPPPPSTPQRTASRGLRRVLIPPLRPQPAIARLPPPVQTPLPAPQVQASLAEAARLADGGRLAEAWQFCERLLRLQGPSAPLYHLMGLVRDAEGLQPQAAELYRKALYLDPGHIETLGHLAVLLERRGQTAEARVLRARAQRAERAVRS